MLTIDQIKALLKEDLRVFQGTGRLYRTVWLEEGHSFADRQPRLMSAHPSDEAGEAWKVVEANAEGMTPCCLSLEDSVGDIHVLREPGARFTKVVKFLPKVATPEGHRPRHAYVTLLTHDPLNDEEACERALDIVLAFGHDEHNCHPLLVI